MNFSNNLNKGADNKSEMERFVSYKHLDFRRIEKYAHDFDLAVPFRYLELRDFLNHKEVVTIKRELERLKFELRKSDLFELFQTTELSDSSEGWIGKFVNLLRSATFRAYLMAITGIDLSYSDISLFGCRYEDTHYLLPHNDKFEGSEDRQIAFIFYFSEINDGNGGELVLYDANNNLLSNGVAFESVRIRPKFNSMIFFEVTSKSLHAVSEIIGVGERYTLAGWFVVKGSNKGEYL